MAKKAFTVNVTLAYKTTKPQRKLKKKGIIGHRSHIFLNRVRFTHCVRIVTVILQSLICQIHMTIHPICNDPN